MVGLRRRGEAEPKSWKLTRHGKDHASYRLRASRPPPAGLQTATTFDHFNPLLNTFHRAASCSCLISPSGKKQNTFTMSKPTDPTPSYDSLFERREGSPRPAHSASGV